MAGRLDFATPTVDMFLPPSIEVKPPRQTKVSYQRRELMPFKIEHTAEKEVDAVDPPSCVERRSTANCRPSTDKAELPAIPGRNRCLAESRALPAWLPPRSASEWRPDGPRCSAIEVLAHDAIEVKNVVRAKGATWSLKAWFDLSSDDSAGGVEGGGGGHRIAFRRPHP